MVMLSNTGGATQAFSSLHGAFLKAMQDKTEWTAKDLLPFVQIVSEERWAQNFGVPEIMMFKELATRAPVLFKKTVVTVDLVKDSAESVLTTVTGCFAAGSGGIPELGLGNAETNMIMNAWKRHLLLWKNAVSLRKNAHIMFAIVSAISFLIALASTFYTLISVNCDESEIKATRLWKKRYQKLLIVLPIIAALFSTVRAKLRLVDKWKICEYAAYQIVTEIYKFRTRTFEYDPARQAEGNGEQESSSSKETKHAASHNNSVAGIVRDTFCTRVQEIFNGVMESDVGRNGYLEYQKRWEWEEGKAAARMFRAELQRHVLLNIHKGTAKIKVDARSMQYSFRLG